jgi:formylglycine-generating enzyme required for sulfatase activity
VTRIFVSYSRSVKTEVGEIVRLLNAAGYGVWWDGDIPPIADWWATICDHIEGCDVFIFFISEKSVQSPYCLAELKYATDRNRPIFPFILDDHTQYTIPPQVTPMRNQWFEYDGSAASIIEEVNEAVINMLWTQFADNPVPRPPEPNSGSGSLVQSFHQAVTLAENGHFDQAIFHFREIRSNDFETWGTRCDKWIRLIQLYKELSELVDHPATFDLVPSMWQEYQTVARQLDNTFDPFDIILKVEDIVSQKEEPIDELPVPSSPSKRVIVFALVFILAMITFGAILLLTRDDPNQSTSHQPTKTDEVITANDTATSTLSTMTISTDTSELTRTSTPELTDTRTPLPTATLTLLPNSTNTLEPINTGTSQPTATPSDPAIALAESGVSSNTEWEPYSPYIQEFNGVEMVLVPAGCFMMGSTDEQINFTLQICDNCNLNQTYFEDEQPAHEQCFDEPFWIDRTEVTRAQYTLCVTAGVCSNPPSSDYSTRDEQPINQVTWFDSRDYCAWRDARLPTEREWEYAARGPSILIYPWGDDFVTTNVVYYRNSGNRTVIVGSHPSGASWVGALDMSGNVWEWVSSSHQGYKYNENDGREDMENDTDTRVLRGGAFDWDLFSMRTAHRFPVANSSFSADNRGLRCVRSYDQITGTSQSTDISIVSTTPTEPALRNIVIVSVPRANLRGKPGTWYEVVGYAVDGEQFVIVEEENNSGGTWYLIQLPNNEFAWISSTVVDVESE